MAFSLIAGAGGGEGGGGVGGGGSQQCRLNIIIVAHTSAVVC